MKNKILLALLFFSLMSFSGKKPEIHITTHTAIGIDEWGCTIWFDTDQESFVFGHMIRWEYTVYTLCPNGMGQTLTWHQGISFGRMAFPAIDSIQKVIY